MSENPLADWLRERGAWPGDADAEASPPSALGASPSAAATESPTGAAGGHGRDLTGPFPLDASGPLPDDWTEESPERPRRPRRLALLGLAAVPWLGFAVVAFGTLGGADAAGQPGEAGDEMGSSAPAAGQNSVDASQAAGSGQTPGDLPPGAGTSSAPADAGQRAAAAAAAAVRTELTGEVTQDSAPVRYVDLAVAESVEWVEDVAVVAVAAVVLESTGDEWGEARLARFAVPVRVTERTAVPIASPWPLPPPAGDESPAWQPVEDGGLAAVAADVVASGGFRDVADMSVQRSHDVPGVLVAEFEAVAPGDEDAATHRVWLRDSDPPSLLAH